MARDLGKPVVLHLARWYPNRYDPMPGLFIQRHIEAANKYCKVGVVYTHIVDKNEDQEELYDIDFQAVNGVPTAKVYYLSSGCKIKPIKKLINILRFFKANNIGIKEVEKTIGKPELIHVHILTRLGIIAWYYYFIKKIPFVVTEHWSRYLDLTGDFKGTLRKYVTRKVAKRASCVTAVTENLAVAMKSHGIDNKNYVILPNVVDDSFLDNYPGEKEISDKKTFLHVSCFEDKSKNISGLLRAISKLSILRNDFVFRMVGDGMDYNSLTSYSKELGLPESVIQYTGLLEGKQLVKEMQNADVLVIFSNYENMPVVINESLSLGIPVIATKVGGIPEVVVEQNGILIDPRDEDQLLKSFNDILDEKLIFNMDNIKKQAINRYSSQAVGKVLMNIYQESLNKN